MLRRAYRATASTSVTCCPPQAIARCAPCSKSGCLAQRPSGRLAGTAVLLDLEIDLLAVDERAQAGCLDRCEQGPVVVIYPEGTWYTYLDESDIDEIVEKHLVQGEIVERLLID